MSLACPCLDFTVTDSLVVSVAVQPVIVSDACVCVSNSRRIPSGLSTNTQGSGNGTIIYCYLLVLSHALLMPSSLHIS